MKKIWMKKTGWTRINSQENKMRSFFAVLVSFVCLFVFTIPAQAQSAVQISGVGINYTFGEQITFSAKIQTQTPIQAAYLLFQVEGEQNTRTIPLAIPTTGATSYNYSIQNGLLRPFARINFWYHLLLSGNEIFDSPHYFFQYDDNRYPWQTVEDSTLRLHWYAGDVSFGQAALDAAQAGYQAIQNLFPVQAAGNPIDIYVYASSADVQDTLNLGGSSWVGGHANPDLGVVLVSIAPGENQSMEMERQIPHELAHVYLYRLTGAAYAALPNWLTEGIASQVEGYPNADYTQVLSASTQSKTLLPISDLCGPFPIDASGAILAYAESNSFVNYVHRTYGTSDLQALIQAYSNGLSCDQGVVHVLGLPLSQLDLQWRQSALGEKVAGLAFQNLLPYLVFLALMLLIPAWRLGLNRKKKEQNANPKPR
jgi:Peptidase MA superfamily